MAEHQWAALIMVPIDHIAVKDDGQLDIFITEAADEIGNEEAKVICWHCDEPLNQATYGTECNPALVDQK